MRPSLRLALLVLGIAAAVYGVASLTGGWLGMPPWWGDWVASDESELGGNSMTDAVNTYLRRQHPDWPRPVERRFTFEDPTGAESLYLRPHRKWFSIGVVVVGLGLVAVGARPRRQCSAAES